MFTSEETFLIEVLGTTGAWLAKFGKILPLNAGTSQIIETYRQYRSTLKLTHGIELANAVSTYCAWAGLEEPFKDREAAIADLKRHKLRSRFNDAFGFATHIVLEQNSSNREITAFALQDPIAKPHGKAVFSCLAEAEIWTEVHKSVYLDDNGKISWYSKAGTQHNPVPLLGSSGCRDVDLVRAITERTAERLSRFVMRWASIGLNASHLYYSNGTSSGVAPDAAGKLISTFSELLTARSAGIFEASATGQPNLLLKLIDMTTYGRYGKNHKLGYSDLIGHKDAADYIVKDALSLLLEIIVEFDLESSLGDKGYLLDGNFI